MGRNPAFCDLKDRLATFEPSFGRSSLISPLDPHSVPEVRFSTGIEQLKKAFAFVCVASDRPGGGAKEIP